MAVSKIDLPEYLELLKDLQDRKTRTPYVLAVLDRLATKPSVVVATSARIENVMRGRIHDWEILIAIREHFGLVGRPSMAVPAKGKKGPRFTPEQVGLQKAG